MENRMKHMQLDHLHYPQQMKGWRDLVVLHETEHFLKAKGSSPQPSLKKNDRINEADSCKASIIR